MRASYPQHGGRAAALMFIESCKRAIIDHIPKIKDWVFNSEDFKEGIQSFVEQPFSVASRRISVKCKVVRPPRNREQRWAA
jgi:hypothetical protein